MKLLKNFINIIFDAVCKAWESRASRSLICILIVSIYIIALIIIESGRQGWFPEHIRSVLPGSHYMAISLAFTFLLYVEVIDLVFGLTQSFSQSVGKQFEIFSLILLRQSFKEFSHLPEPLHWPEPVTPVLVILSSAFGALIIFSILVCYYRMIHHQPITKDEKETEGFITAKKAVSLILLGTFILSGLYHFAAWTDGDASDGFFTTFYTILVYSDILIVLFSLYYSHSYSVVFRNSGYALATVVLRLALTAPPYYNAALGIGASLYALILKAVYNRFVPVEKRVK